MEDNNFNEMMESCNFEDKEKVDFEQFKRIILEPPTNPAEEVKFQRRVDRLSSSIASHRMFSKSRKMTQVSGMNQEDSELAP